MSENNFLPEGYEIPITGGDYLQFEDGATKFRILSKKIVDGYIGWNKNSDDENEPLRVHRDNKAAAADYDRDGKAKFFWVLVVWDYKGKRIKILELTQQTIIKPIMGLVQDASWGHPKKYDITVTKKGEKLKTEYTVTPAPPSKISKEIIAAASQYEIDLDKLFENEDPFIKKPEGLQAAEVADDDDNEVDFEEQLKAEAKAKAKSKDKPVKKKAAEVTEADDDDDDDDDAPF